MDIRKYEEHTIVSFRTELGEMQFSDYQYTPYDTMNIKTDAPMKLQLTLKMWVRVLVELFGYATVKSAIDNYPEPLRKGKGADNDSQ